MQVAGNHLMQYRQDMVDRFGTLGSGEPHLSVTEVPLCVRPTLDNMSTKRASQSREAERIPCLTRQRGHQRLQIGFAPAGSAHGDGVDERARPGLAEVSLGAVQHPAV